MRNLVDVISEGFFKNVTPDIKNMREWMGKVKFRYYSPYNITFYPEDLTMRLHNDKHSTSKKDIIVPINEYWQYLKKIKPNNLRVGIQNKFTGYHALPGETTIRFDDIFHTVLSLVYDKFTNTFQVIYHG